MQYRKENVFVMSSVGALFYFQNLFQPPSNVRWAWGNWSLKKWCNYQGKSVRDYTISPRILAQGTFHGLDRMDPTNQLREHVWDEWAGDIGLRSPLSWTDLGWFPYFLWAWISSYGVGNKEGAGPIYIPLYWRATNWANRWKVAANLKSPYSRYPCSC